MIASPPDGRPRNGPCAVPPAATAAERLPRGAPTWQVEAPLGASSRAAPRPGAAAVRVSLTCLYGPSGRTMRPYSSFQT